MATVLSCADRAVMSSAAACWTSAPDIRSVRPRCRQQAGRQLVGNEFMGAPPLKRFWGSERPLSDARKTVQRAARAPVLRCEKGEGVRPNQRSRSIDRELHPNTQTRWDALGQRQGIDVEMRANHARTWAGTPADTCEIFLSSIATYVRPALR